MTRNICPGCDHEHYGDDRCPACHNHEHYSSDDGSTDNCTIWMVAMITVAAAGSAFVRKIRS